MGTIVVALGRPKLSSKSLLYQPARRQPTWTSHGQTAAGGASMVIALVDLNWAWRKSSSPGSDAVTSAVVAPQWRCHLR